MARKLDLPSVDAKRRQCGVVEGQGTGKVLGADRNVAEHRSFAPTSSDAPDTSIDRPETAARSADVEGPCV